MFFTRLPNTVLGTITAHPNEPIKVDRTMDPSILLGKGLFGALIYTPLKPTSREDQICLLGPLFNNTYATTQSRLYLSPGFRNLSFSTSYPIELCSLTGNMLMQPETIRDLEGGQSIRGIPNCTALVKTQQDILENLDLNEVLEDGQMGITPFEYIMQAMAGRGFDSFRLPMFMFALDDPSRFQHSLQ